MRLIVITIAFLFCSPGYASNFVRVPLGEGASIEVPKNWSVYSENKRTTIETFIESMGYRQAKATMNFAASMYGDNGKNLASIHVRFYPENQITQAIAKQITLPEIKEFDAELRNAVEATSKDIGVRVLNWYGSKMQLINGLYVLIHEHQNSSINDAGITRVRGLRVWRSPRSFTVTLSYKEQASTVFLPIIDYMANSLKQE